MFLFYSDYLASHSIFSFYRAYYPYFSSFLCLELHFMNRDVSLLKHPILSFKNQQQIQMQQGMKLTTTDETRPRQLDYSYT